jgi:two-component system, chemotaxis family, sensor kinase CheA
MAGDPYKYFRVEAAELLEQLSQGVLRLDQGVASFDVIPALLRQAHTLKGAARIVKRLAIAEAAHALEELLAPHRNEAAPTLPRDVISSTFTLLDRISGELSSLDLPTAASPQPAAAFGTAGGSGPNAETASSPSTALGSGASSNTAASSSARSSGSESGSVASNGTASSGTHSGIEVGNATLAEATPRTLRTDVSELDALLTGLSEIMSEQAEQAQRLRKLFTLRQLTDSLNQEIGWASQDSGQASTDWASSARARCTEISRGLRNLENELRDSVDRAAGEIEQVHTRAQGLRLVAAETIFTFLERVARDAAHELHKRVVLVTRGGLERIDGHVLEIVQNVLLHLVRNAVAHGIETPEERIRLGKEPIGRVWIEVERARQRLVFRCRDDGRGVDIAALRQKLLSESASLNDEQLLDRLLQGGISTAARVSGLAGRGVGLDMARDAMERLGGKLKFHTEWRRGVSIELMLPATLRLIEGLRLESWDARAIVPLQYVVSSMRLDDSVAVKSELGRSISYEGGILPLISLERALGRTPSPTQQRTALILRGERGRIAVSAQRLGEVKRAVLHELPTCAQALPTIAGVVLDSAGSPELVLDVDGVLNEIEKTQDSDWNVASRVRTILVVDDSLTTRMLEQSILESCGYQVELACSAEEGLEKTQERPYDLCLVDVEMPGMDGFSFITQLRANPQTRATPAVLVSSRSAREDLERGTAVGAQGYIIKHQFDQREFLSLVERLTDPR